MIEWKRYGNTRDMQPPSHEPCLVTDGEFAKIAVHELDTTVHNRTYTWLDHNGYRVAGVTHYVVINWPKDGEPR